MLTDDSRRLGGSSKYVRFSIHNGVPKGQTRVEFGCPLELGQRGAIIADNWGLGGSGDQLEINWLAATDATYRMALLFNDIVDLPSFPEKICAPDPLNLESAGLIRRSRVMRDGTIQHEMLASLEAITYKVLDQNEPGAWSLWHEPDFDPIPTHFRTNDLAIRAAINDAIIVPARDVPFEDVVDFRQRNLPQLRKLRKHLDQIAIKISSSGTDPTHMRLELEILQEAIAEYSEEARKPNWKKALGSLEFSINLLPATLTIATGVMASAAAGIPLLQAASVIGATVIPNLELKSVRGFKLSKNNSPFEYIATIREELY